MHIDKDSDSRSRLEVIIIMVLCVLFEIKYILKTQIEINYGTNTKDENVELI
jgi:hypothetical protein